MAKSKMSTLEWIVFLLVVIGGINWGLYGLFSFDIVKTIFTGSFIGDIVYTLIGLAALYKLYVCFK